jgi:metal-sulfur cluster biosynthetic enzyme
MRRREAASPHLVTIWWRDIPAQVNGVDGLERVQVQLDWRFQWAIERAARKASLNDAHEFTKRWRRTTAPVVGDVGAAARNEAARIDARYNDDFLTVLVESGGVEVPEGTRPRPRVVQNTNRQNTNPQNPDPSADSGS